MTASEGWLPMETAPKDRKIEGLYDGEPDLIIWQETRSCSGIEVGVPGSAVGMFGDGWVSIEAGYLPVDAPEKWREAP